MNVAFAYMQIRQVDHKCLRDGWKSVLLEGLLDADWLIILGLGRRGQKNIQIGLEKVGLWFADSSFDGG